MSLVFAVERGQGWGPPRNVICDCTFGSNPLGLHREKQDEVQQHEYLNRETQGAFSPNR